MKTYGMWSKYCNLYPSDSSETLKYMLTTINSMFHDLAFFVLFYRLLHCRNIHVNLLASMLTCISMICCVIHQFYLVLQLIHSLLVSEDYISYSLFVSEDHISKSKSQLKLLLLLKIIVLPNNQVFCLYRVMPCWYEPGGSEWNSKVTRLYQRTIHVCPATNPGYRICFCYEWLDGANGMMYDHVVYF